MQKINAHAQILKSLIKVSNSLDVFLQEFIRLQENLKSLNVLHGFVLGHLIIFMWTNFNLYNILFFFFRKSVVHVFNYSHFKIFYQNT